MTDRRTDKRTPRLISQSPLSMEVGSITTTNWQHCCAEACTSLAEFHCTEAYVTDLIISTPTSHATAVKVDYSNPNNGVITNPLQLLQTPIQQPVCRVFLFFFYFFFFFFFFSSSSSCPFSPCFPGSRTPMMKLLFVSSSLRCVSEVDVLEAPKMLLYYSSTIIYILLL